LTSFTPPRVFHILHILKPNSTQVGIWQIHVNLYLPPDLKSDMLHRSSLPRWVATFYFNANQHQYYTRVIKKNQVFSLKIM